jgi:hypothetical protein
MSRRTLLTAVAGLALLAALWAGRAGAELSSPTGCRADGRCVGLPLRFHTAGVARSTSPIWAGQWMFTDEKGTLRKGTCTFNRGAHPVPTLPAHRVAQKLPRDPSGAKSAYLTWRYGGTSEGLTAAAVWAVMHYYAADQAGSERADDPTSPLVPRLDSLAAMTGHAEVQAKAVALDREARLFSAPWRVAAHLETDGSAAVTVWSGVTPVPGVTVSVLVSGRDTPLALPTGADGTARVTVPLVPGTVTLVGLAEAPGLAQAYRGVPAFADPHGSQVLVTAGPPRTLRATATLVVPTTTTTATTTTTTTTVSPTTVPETTVPATTVPETTVPPTTVQPTTVPATTVPPTTVPPRTRSTTTTTSPPTTATETTVGTTTAPPTTVVLPPPLPHTGGRPDGGIALLATALLVGGIGLLGTLRRGA